jgi:hypothetical protein
MPGLICWALIVLQWCSLKYIQNVHSNFKYEVVDGQHYLKLFFKFLHADKTLPDFQKRLKRASEMQASHVAKIFVSRNPHGEDFFYFGHSGF